MRPPRIHIGMFGIVGALLLASLADVGCGPTVDLATSLKVADLTTGWAVAGMVDGENKIVPAARFKLENLSNQTLRALQINAVFRQQTTGDEWGSAFDTVPGSGGLAPQSTTDSVLLRSSMGHTGIQSPTEMLQNQYFVDAKLELFAKYGSGQWIKLIEHPIERRLLAD